MTIFGLEEQPGHKPIDKGATTQYNHETQTVACSCGKWEQGFRPTKAGSAGTRIIRMWVQHVEISEMDSTFEARVGTVTKTRVETEVKIITSLHPLINDYDSKDRLQYYWNQGRVMWAWVMETSSISRAGGAITKGRPKFSLGGFLPDRDRALLAAKQYMENQESNAKAKLDWENEGGLITVTTLGLHEGITGLLDEADAIIASGDLTQIIEWRAKVSKLTGMVRLLEGRDREMDEMFSSRLTASMDF